MNLKAIDGAIARSKAEKRHYALRQLGRGGIQIPKGRPRLIHEGDHMVYIHYTTPFYGQSYKESRVTLPASRFLQEASNVAD